MNDKLKSGKSKMAAIAALVVIVGLGCLCLPVNIAPTSAPPPEPSPTFGAVPFTPGTVVETGNLNTQGPWLLIQTDQGLWAANPDGSGLTQLTDGDYWYDNFQAAVQPNGNMVAYLTPAGSDLHNLALNLLAVPRGNSTIMTALTSEATERYADLNLGDNGFEALRAIRDQPSFAWSPDGTRLAFAGAMQGPSADIYIFDLFTQEIRRVSQDAAQDFAPSWSPDGNYLVYLSVEGFGTGAGWSMSGVWAVDTSGGSPYPISPATGTGEEIVGWLDDTTVVLATWAQPCGLQRLRLYDVVTRQEIMLNEGCFNSAAADSWGGAAMFSNDDGLYMLTADDRTPFQVGQEPNARIDPLLPGDYIFTVRFDLGGIITYGVNDIDQQASPVNADAGLLDVAVYGAIWGWTSMDEGQPGAWITGPGIEIGQIYTGQAAHPIWDLHNNLIFFAPQDPGGYAIYRTTFDSYYRDLTQVNSIDAGVWALAWLGEE